MRIIGGTCRGRALAPVGKGDAAAHLRPTTDRIRESLFNVLSGGRYDDPITGAHVLDLFAGTGALGLEAYSRGAEAVTFVENGRKGQSLIAQNIALCGAHEHARLIRRDARKPGSAPRAHQLVFLDPPYGKSLGEYAVAAALQAGWISGGALIVWEESQDIAVPDGCSVLETRRFGTSQIHFLRASSPSVPPRMIS